MQKSRDIVRKRHEKMHHRGKHQCPTVFSIFRFFSKSSIDIYKIKKKAFLINKKGTILFENPKSASYYTVPNTANTERIVTSVTESYKRSIFVHFSSRNLCLLITQILSTMHKVSPSVCFKNHSGCTPRAQTQCFDNHSEAARSRLVHCTLKIRFRGV